MQGGSLQEQRRWGSPRFYSRTLNLTLNLPTDAAPVPVPDAVPAPGFQPRPSGPLRGPARCVFLKGQQDRNRESIAP